MLFKDIQILCSFAYKKINQEILNSSLHSYVSPMLFSYFSLLIIVESGALYPSTAFCWLHLMNFLYNLDK